MGELGAIRTVLAGFTGGPGYNTLYFFGDPYSNATAESNADAVGAFWNGMIPTMPAGTTFAIDPDVQVLDEATGALIRIESIAPPTQTNAGTSGQYSAGVGANVRWNTDGVHLTKRLRGRTFVVPLSGGSYDATGTINNTNLTAMRALATTLGAVANFGVWGRPVGGAGGEWAACTGATIKDQVSWLTTRRT